MKKIWLYIALIIFEAALGLAHGLVLQNFLSIEICLIAAFGIPFAVLYVSSKNKQDTIIKLMETLFASLLLTAVAIGVFSSGNRLHGEFIDEYDVSVEYVNGRGGGYAEFTTPQGKEGRVDLHDYRPIIVGDDYVDVGDKIRVQEYKGIFNKIYYVFVIIPVDIILSFILVTSVYLFYNSTFAIAKTSIEMKNKKARKLQ